MYVRSEPILSYRRILISVCVLVLFTFAVCGRAAAATEKLVGRWWPCVSTAHTRVMLSSELNEKISSILVEEGEVVEEGQKLLQFDASVIDARIQVAKLEADYGVRLKLARTAYRYRAEEYRRRKEMGEFGKPSKKREAKHQMRQADLQVEELKHERKRSLAELELLRRRKDQYTVTSPIDGVVSNVKVEEGELKELGADLIEVVDPKLIEIPVHVPERYLADVEKGQSVTVRFTESDVDPMPGKVDAVLPLVSGSSGMLTVKVLVEAPTKKIVPGMQCEVKFSGSAGNAEGKSESATQ